MKSTDPVSSEVREQLHASSGWGIAIAVVLMLLGVVAIARPLYATIASTLVFGWLFIAAGVAQLLYAIRSPRVGQFIWKLLLSMLYLGAGVYTVANPMSGAIALTLVLGITIFVQGAIEVILAFQLRPAPNWGVVLFGGIVAIILGIFIWSRFPDGADWIVGLWVGIHFLFSGIWILTLSLALRSVVRQDI